MKKILSLLVFMALFVGCSSSESGIELELITDHWNDKDSSFDGYDLSLGEFSDDDVARIGDNGSTVLSLNRYNDDTIRNYSALIRHGYANGNIEELAMILGFMITAALEDNPSLSLTDIDNLKDYIETETNFETQGHQIRFSGDKSDTFYMHVYINSGE